MTRRILSLAFPFMDSFDTAPANTAATETLHMDEETFRGLYSRTSGMLWAYLSRSTGDPSVADDLLQEAYYRILRARVSFESDDHRRHYLFRIAANLVRDRVRRPLPDQTPLPEGGNEPAAFGDLAVQTQQRADFERAMKQLTPRERDLVWLAYGHGSSHQEIAGALGLRTASIKPLLFRARRKLIKFLSR
jgi:RNA polymerase sigma-70 factor (ECF subfamily)